MITRAAAADERMQPRAGAPAVIVEQEDRSPEERREPTPLPSVHKRPFEEGVVPFELPPDRGPSAARPGSRPNSQPGTPLHGPAPAHSLEAQLENWRRLWQAFVENAAAVLNVSESSLEVSGPSPEALAAIASNPLMLEHMNLLLARKQALQSGRLQSPSASPPRARPPDSGAPLEQQLADFQRQYTAFMQTAAAIGFPVAVLQSSPSPEAVAQIAANPRFALMLHSYQSLYEKQVELGQLQEAARRAAAGESSKRRRSSSGCTETPAVTPRDYREPAASPAPLAHVAAGPGGSRRGSREDGDDEQLSAAWRHLADAQRALDAARAALRAAADARAVLERRVKEATAEAARARAGTAAAGMEVRELEWRLEEAGRRRAAAERGRQEAEARAARAEAEAAELREQLQLASARRA